MYIAGPLTSSPYSNVKEAVEVADNLMEHGFYPYLPHLTSLWAMIMGDKPFNKWLEFDEAWLSRCDAVLRLPGESPGSDREVEYAKSIGIPVFYSLSDVFGARNALQIKKTADLDENKQAEPVQKVEKEVRDEDKEQVMGFSVVVNYWKCADCGYLTPIMKEVCSNCGKQKDETDVEVME